MRQEILQERKTKELRLNLEHLLLQRIIKEIRLLQDRVVQVLEIKEVLHNLVQEWVHLEEIQANEIVPREVIRVQEVQILEPQEEDKS